MKSILTLTFTFIASIVAGQVTQQTLSKKELLLNNLKQSLQDSITRIDEELVKIKYQQGQLEYSDTTKKLHKRYYAEVIGIKPYMSSKPIFGDITYLQEGDKVEIIDFEDRKLKIKSSKGIGYISPSNLQSNSELDEFIEYAKRRNTFLKVKNKVQAQSIEAAFDSIKRSYGDSSFFIVRTSEGLKVGLYKTPEFKNKIAVVTHKDVLKINIFYNQYIVGVYDLSHSVAGYINNGYIDTNEELREYFNKEGEKSLMTRFNKLYKPTLTKLHKEQAEAKKRRQVAYAKRKANLTKQYGAVKAQKILNHEYWLGMSTKQALESLGYPNTINESVGSWGRNEQWVYENLYLYFENGVLTSYQK